MPIVHASGRTLKPLQMRRAERRFTALESIGWTWSPVGLWAPKVPILHRGSIRPQKHMQWPAALQAPIRPGWRNGTCLRHLWPAGPQVPIRTGMPIYG